MNKEMVNERSGKVFQPDAVATESKSSLMPSAEKNSYPKSHWMPECLDAPIDRKGGITTVKKKETPVPNPQILSDSKALEEILLTTPVERIEKLKLLAGNVSPAIDRALKKRIIQLEHELECFPLREKVQEINERLARCGRGVNHG